MQKGATCVCGYWIISIIVLSACACARACKKNDFLNQIFDSHLIMSIDSSELPIQFCKLSFQSSEWLLQTCKLLIQTCELSIKLVNCWFKLMNCQLKFVKASLNLCIIDPNYWITGSKVIQSYKSKQGILKCSAQKEFKTSYWAHSDSPANNLMHVVSSHSRLPSQMVQLYYRKIKPFWIRFNMERYSCWKHL